MFIHKSFSLSELIDIVEIFEMEIIDYDDFYKKGLTFYIEFYLHNLKPLNFNNEFFDFKNHYDLINYLQSPNDKFKLSIQRKKELNKHAKSILCYCKEYRNDDFDTYFKLAESLKLYGDLPSVRKAINAINRYSNKPYVIKYENSVFYLKNIKKKKYVKLKFNNFKFNKESKNHVFN